VINAGLSYVKVQYLILIDVIGFNCFPQ